MLVLLLLPAVLPLGRVRVPGSQETRRLGGEEEAVASQAQAVMAGVAVVSEERQGGYGGSDGSRLTTELGRFV